MVPVKDFKMIKEAIIIGKTTSIVIEDSSRVEIIIIMTELQSLMVIQMVRRERDGNLKVLQEVKKWLKFVQQGEPLRNIVLSQIMYAG